MKNSFIYKLLLHFTVAMSTNNEVVVLYCVNDIRVKLKQLHAERWYIYSIS